MTEENQTNITKLISFLGLGEFLFKPSLDSYYKSDFPPSGLITYINLISVKLYIKINNIFSVCKVVACLIVIVAGAYELIIGNTKNLTKGFEGTTTDVGLMALAFYNGISTLFEKNFKRY